MKLWRYIQGFRKGKEAHRLERESMNDPFLADALDGYDRVKGNHKKNLEELQKQVKKKASKRINYLRPLSIAASILIILGIGSIFIIKENKLPNDIQQVTSQELQPETPVIQPQPEAITKQQNAIAQSESQKQTQTPVNSEATPPTVDIVMSMDDKADISMEETEMVIIQDHASAMNKEIVMPREIDSATEKNLRRSPVVKGKVVDKSGEPLVGANVMVGAKKGAITNSEGYFELSVSDTNKITVNYIGFDSQTILPDTNKTMLIAMHENKTAMDEVVVTQGYAARSKSQKIETSVAAVGIDKKDFKKYVEENLKRPADEECKDVKGKVKVEFYVNAQGRPYNIAIKKSLCPSADKEAIRLISDGPNWSPSNRELTIDIKF